MKYHYFRHKPRLLLILLMIAAASIAVRALFHYRFHETALLYIGVPFLIALILVLVRSPNENISWQRRYLNRLIDAFIIMFGSSVVLFEGFVCVAMFIPIYLAVMLLVFIADYMIRRSDTKNRSTLSVHILPILIFISAYEGVGTDFSFNREEEVAVTRAIPIRTQDVKRNLVLPMNLRTSRPWFLYLFPMPYDIKAGSLVPGDVHEIYFQYYRWFVTNLHEGKMQLLIAEASDNHIKARFIHDSSYIANYLRLKSMEIVLTETDSHYTLVTLTIRYQRTLDPYWYFSPVTQYGVSKTAEFLIDEVIARDNH